MTTTGLAGVGALVRVRVRVDRVRLALWTLGIVLMVALSAASMRDFFPTQADLDAAAAGSDNPAILAFNGPAQALDTLGGQVAFQIGAPGFTIAALASIMLGIRLTRREEESGRLELVRSLPVGRDASMAAAAIVLGVMHLVIGVAVALSCWATDLPVAGCISFGIGFTMVGWVFAAITLVTAQVSSSARAAGGLAGVVLAASYVLRAIGDMTNGAVSWLSPIGWVQHARPWADERWWVFAVPVAATIALGWLAVRLLELRDLGAGLFAERGGPPVAAPSLASPLALAVRLQRGIVLGWSVGLAVFGLAYGLIVEAIEEFVEDNATMEDLFAAAGGASLTDSYLAQSARILALIAAGFAAQSVLRARSEEAEQRAEPVLAGAVSRRAWLASHAIVAGVGSAIVLLVAGVSLGGGAAAVTGDVALLPEVVGASLGHLPALLVIVGFGLALTGWLPRGTALTWATVALAFVIGMFGALLDLPVWVADLSPFEHVALVPAESWSAVPLAVLAGVATALTVAGFVGLDRRDIPA